MLVKLTLSPERTDLYVRVQDIIIIQKDPKNALQTIVQLALMTPKGPLSYAVQESPSEIASQMTAGGYNKVTN